VSWPALLLVCLSVRLGEFVGSGLDCVCRRFLFLRFDYCGCPSDMNFSIGDHAAVVLYYVLAPVDQPVEHATYIYTYTAKLPVHVIMPCGAVSLH
jgi:hypothetical protein